MRIEHEDDVVRGRPLLVTAGIAAAVLAVAFAVTWWFVTAPVSAAVPARRAAAEGGILGTPARGPSLAASWNEEARAELSSLGWVDEPAGIAHVPIDDAIDLYLASSGRSAP